jgi:hypothetical protein
VRSPDDGLRSTVRGTCLQVHEALPGLLPPAPSRAAEPVRLKKASRVFHRLVTGCGKDRSRIKIGLVPTPGRTDGLLERAPSAPPVTGRASMRGVSPSVPAGREFAGPPQTNRLSPMEGTSGAAEPALLRGSAGDAALGSAVRFGVPMRKRGTQDTKRPGPHAPTLRGGGARVVGSSKALLPHRSISWRRRSLHPAKPRSHDERCPSGSGWGRGISQSPARANAHEPPSRATRRGWLSAGNRARIRAPEKLLAAKHASP